MDKSFFGKASQCGCGFLICLLAAGCALTDRTRPSGDSNLVNERGVVAPSLTANVMDSGALAAVNSIAIARPAFVDAEAQGGLSADDVSTVIERIAREKMTLKVVAAPRGAKVKAGGELTTQADAVLRTEILRFDKRQGSAFGGEPATVSFRMNLESRAKGKPMWSAQYFLRQEAVSENLLRLSERVGSAGLGAGWKSAHEVFERGVAAALADLNSKREAQFLAKGLASPYLSRSSQRSP